MNLDSVRLFVLAAEKLNISAAGRVLGVVPAVASTRLVKLEKELGVSLLHRTTRKVSLSLEGAEFLPFAKEMLAQQAAALAALGKGQATISGTLRFTAPSTFAQLYISPILPKFLNRHPDLTLDLRLSDTQFDLIEGSYDLSLRNEALADSSFKGRKLAKDTRILCASPQYLEKFGSPKHPDHLLHHRLIAFKDMSSKEIVDQDGNTGEFSPRESNSRLIIDDGQNQKLATIAGAGISINSLWSVHRELLDGTLVRVLPQYQLAENAALWLVYPNSHVLTAKVRAFIDFLIEEIGTSPVWKPE